MCVVAELVVDAVHDGEGDVVAVQGVERVVWRVCVVFASGSLAGILRCLAKSRGRIVELVS